MIIFYSGARSKHVAPETTLAKYEPSLMLTFSDFYNKKRNDSIRRFQQYKKRMKKHERTKGKS